MCIVSFLLYVSLKWLLDCKTDLVAYCLLVLEANFRANEKSCLWINVYPVVYGLRAKHADGCGHFVFIIGPSKTSELLGFDVAGLLMLAPHTAATAERCSSQSLVRGHGHNL